MSDLYEFDFSDFPENAAIIASGKRRSGKNYLTRDLVYNYFRGNCETAFLFSPTSEIAINSFDFIPKEYRYEEYNIDIVEKILQRQKSLIMNTPNKPNKHKTLLILDDLQSSNDGVKRKHIEKLFLTARHFRVSLIVNFQFPKVDMSPTIRDNVDVIFVFPQNSYSNKELFALQYLSIDDNKKRGFEIINQYALGYQCLVINNTETSNKYQDFCYYYKADNVPQKFKIGREYMDSLS